MSSESSSVVKRTVRRTIIGGGPVDDVGDIHVQRTYQVYRGMSPNTSNRLELRIRELEDALEQERQHRVRIEQELYEYTSEYDSMAERLEEADGLQLSAGEISRRREQENIKLKKDIELLTIQYESSEASLRKRHQEALNELAEQLDHLNKHKAKFEKEKQTYIIEIENLSTAFDSANKAKLHYESKFGDLEDQLRRARLQIEELSRLNGDLNNWKARLSQENLDLQRQVQELDSSNASLAKIKSVLSAQLDEAKARLDEETREKNQLTIIVTNLQVDLDNLNARLDEETENAANLRAQLQRALADYAALKSKYDKDITMRIEEFEESRRKMVARIAELENEAEQARNRAGKLEKDKMKLQIEIRDISVELEALNANLADCTKRLKQAEGSNGELIRRIDELTVNFNNANGENQRLAAELVRLRAALAELQDKYDALLRENKLLSDNFRDAQSQNKDLSRQVQELLSIRGQLEAERDRLAAELAETSDALRDALARLDAANASLNQLRVDFEHRLRQKDDELEAIRKNGQRTVEELQRTILEIETKYKAELSRYKKKYETDLRELEIQIETLSRSNGELGKANKSLATRVKELEISIEEERRNGDDAKNTLTLLERKRIALQTELEDVRALLEAAERARKNAESSLAESSTRINELTISITSLSNERRRYEGDLAAISADAEEAHKARRAAEERADRLQLEVNRLIEELRREQENYKNADSVRKSLEIEIREITVRLEEAEAFATREGKRLVAKLQARVHDLEAELDAEQRRGRDVIAENRKLQRLLQEIRAQADEDHRLVSELTEQVNSYVLKITLLKRQLIEAEEVIQITMSKYRKAQQMLEDCERRAETAERNISQTIHITRHHVGGGGPGSRARSMSVTRESSRIIRA